MVGEILAKIYGIVGRNPSSSHVNFRKNKFGFQHSVKILKTENLIINLGSLLLQLRRRESSLLEESIKRWTFLNTLGAVPRRVSINFPHQEIS